MNDAPSRAAPLPTEAWAGTPTGAEPVVRPDTALSALGILGWGALEPVVVAALATEAPLLVVGAHGTAKTLLFERLAAALGLDFRHYNASTLNFDDLVGFPVPEGGAVRYLRTPLDCWEAEALFVDELSRCRPDMQNRLFPLIHERRLQGQALARLRHRWAAMNPPPLPDADPRSSAYLGAEPLDAALADRFPFVLEAPTELEPDDRRRLIRGNLPCDPQPLRLAVDSARAELATTAALLGDAIASYVDVATHALAKAGLPQSPRRLRSLFDGIVAIVATRRAGRLADAALLGLTWSLPQRAQGPVAAGPVLAAHRAALAMLADPRDPVRRRLVAATDPVDRIAIALSGSDDALLATVLLDARAALPEDARPLVAGWLFGRLARKRPGLPGMVFETLAADMARLQALQECTEQVNSASPRYALAGKVAAAVATLRLAEAWIADALWLAYRENTLGDPDRVVTVGRKLMATLPRKGDG